MISRFKKDVKVNFIPSKNQDGPKVIFPDKFGTMVYNIMNPDTQPRKSKQEWEFPETFSFKPEQEWDTGCEYDD